jgi:fructoselysine-6-P-deglycase FrlB-like protein
MGLITSEFKTKYNTTLANYNKGDKWTSDAGRSAKEVEGGCRRLTELAQELSIMMMEFKKTTSNDMLDSEVLHGFA